MVDPADYPGWNPGRWPTCMKCNADFSGGKQPYCFGQPGFKPYLFLCEPCHALIEANPEPLVVVSANDHASICFDRGHHEAVSFTTSDVLMVAECRCGSKINYHNIRDAQTWPLGNL